MGPGLVNGILIVNALVGSKYDAAESICLAVAAPGVDLLAQIMSGKLHTRESLGNGPSAKKYTSHYAFVLAGKFYNFCSGLRAFFFFFPATPATVWASGNLSRPRHTRVYISQYQTCTCA